MSENQSQFWPKLTTVHFLESCHGGEGPLHWHLLIMYLSCTCLLQEEPKEFPSLDGNEEGCKTLKDKLILAMEEVTCYWKSFWSWLGVTSWSWLGITSYYPLTWHGKVFDLLETLLVGHVKDEHGKVHSWQVQSRWRWSAQVCEGVMSHKQHFKLNMMFVFLLSRWCSTSFLYKKLLKAFLPNVLLELRR